ncbi:hypothetical protein [Hyphomonas sp.]|uniref:hypothetical protein n=1 Tax=Hyphomonas sp. TaxID=87 RepID=UPI0025C0F6BE|nr:hypothetical protein [Hyphomonas sp.]
MRLSVIASGIALVAICAACASSHPGQEMTLEEGARIECRNVQQSGTILPKRVCNNKATWAAIEARNKEQAENFDRAVNDRYLPIPPKEVSIPTRPRQ